MADQTMNPESKINPAKDEIRGRDAAQVPVRRQSGRHENLRAVITGVLFIILGIIALSLPVASTVGLMFAIAALLVATGVVHFVQAFQFRNEPGNYTRFLRAAIAGIAGGLMFRYPAGGMLSVALALSFYFLVGAALQWILSTVMIAHRGWMRASAVISFLMGVVMIVTVPFSAFWVPGMLLGIDLIYFGFTLIALALATRKARPERPLASYT